MATELCATAFIRSLPDDMAKELQDEMNKLNRSEYTFEMCIEKALAQKKQGSIVGGERLLCICSACVHASDVCGFPDWYHYLSAWCCLH